MTEPLSLAEQIAETLRKDMASVEKLKAAKLKHMARRADESDFPVYPTGTPCE